MIYSTTIRKEKKKKISPKLVTNGGRGRRRPGLGSVTPSMFFLLNHSLEVRKNIDSIYFVCYHLGYPIYFNTVYFNLIYIDLIKLAFFLAE